MEHEHVFDRRDTNHSRCIDCKAVVNDPGKQAKPRPQPIAPLVAWLNNLAQTVHVYNDDPKKGSVYVCTEANFGKDWTGLKRPAAEHLKSFCSFGRESSYID